MVTKLKVDGANKSFYQIGEQTIQSTIPPIRLDNLIVGIEYLDYDGEVISNVYVEELVNDALDSKSSSDVYNK